MHSADGGQEPPRSDLKDATGWIALGIAVLVAALRMDRLEAQNINPYTVPGLLPGLLGIAMILLGGALGVRSLRRGAWRQSRPATTEAARVERRRIAIVLTLVLGYGLVLIGHPSMLVRLVAPGSLAGLPYWLASTMFVSTAILVLQRLDPDPTQRRLTARWIGKALAIGLGVSLAIQFVFQELFLVRLP